MNKVVNENILKVRYKYNNQDRDGDLVCELTEFMDKYLLDEKMLRHCCTYLYNDLEVFSSNNLIQIAFRYPRATRGGIILKRLDSRKFEIMGFQFNIDVCFGEYACYKVELQNDIDKYIGAILDFSDVTLVNNGLV